VRVLLAALYLTRSFPLARVLAVVGAVLALAAPAARAAADEGPAQVHCSAERGAGADRFGGGQARLRLHQGDAAKERLSGTIEACRAGDAGGKLAAALADSEQTFAKLCTGTSRRDPGAPKLPPYGATDPATVHGAALQMNGDLVHDVFGPDLDAAIVREFGRRRRGEVPAGRRQAGAEMRRRHAQGLQRLQDERPRGWLSQAARRRCSDSAKSSLMRAW
jgi:hypothetical protein